AADAQRARRPRAWARLVRLAARGRLGLGLLSVLDDVTRLKEDTLRDLPPARRAAQQKLEIHAEVLELLALGVPHDRERLAVALDRQALLIPADRVSLLGERGA